MLTEEQRKKALDDLKKLKGLPPYDTWANICYGDGYFAKSLERTYGMSISELEKETGLFAKQKSWKRAKRLADSILD